MSDRRSFIKKSAVLAASASALTSMAYEDVSADESTIPVTRGVKPPRDADPVRIAVIGTGGMGTEHCRAFSRFAQAGKADVQIVAISDVCVPRLTAAAEAIKKITPNAEFKQYTDYRQVIADPTIHGVLIASPEHWHGRMAEEAMLAGKDVYMEKPMTLRLKQGMHLREVWRRNPDRIAVVGTQFTTYATYLEAKKVIAADGIGKPIFSQTSYCRNSKAGEWLYKLDPAWKPGENLDWKMWLGDSKRIPYNAEIFGRWRRYKDFSTGIIGDLLVHYMTPLVMALDVGWPTRVVASGGHYIDKTMENHDQVNINAQFEKEHTMVVAGSTCNELGLETLVRGHKANLYLTSKKMTVRPEQAFTEEVEPKEFTAPDTGDPQDTLRMEWLDGIRNRTQPASTIELGTKIMVIVDLATRSMWTGNAYSFDPATMRVREI
ncbi:MAG: Gfo/Idh/MocA family oxidoreductase [Longimicrobiales bacterium]